MAKLYVHHLLTMCLTDGDISLCSLFYNLADCSCLQEKQALLLQHGKTHVMISSMHF